MPSQADPELRHVEEIGELVQLVDIEDILIWEERARRVVWTEEEKAERSFPVIRNSLGVQNDAERMRYRFRSVFSDENAEYVADAEITYLSPEPIQTTAELRSEFAERVAFMAIYPFVRASIHGSAARLNLPAPVLSIVRQGEFSLGEPLSVDEAREEFGDNRSETLERQ